MKKGEWLSPIYRNLLWRLELAVTNPPIERLDADALWSESRGGGKITETQGNTSRRLFDALQQHNRSTEERRPNGRIVPATKTFTDVVVCLHPDVYHGALIESGQVHLNAFLNNLAINHQEDFKKSLPQNRLPRYLVQPDPYIEKNHVVFLFGPAIYIPDANEAAAELTLTLGEQRIPPHRVECWREGRHQTLPIQFYAGQEFLLIVPDHGQPLTPTLGRMVVPGWRSDTMTTRLLLRRTDTDQWGVYLDVNPYSPRRASTTAWIFAVPVNAEQTLKLDITTASPSTTAPPQQDMGKTLILGVSDAAAHYQLLLEGILLPASPTLSWTVWLDLQGGLANPTSLNGSRKLVQLAYQRNKLVFINEAGVSTDLGPTIPKVRRIELPGGSILLLPAPEGLKHCAGLLRLPALHYYLVGQDVLTLGRFDAQNPTNSPEIALDQLEQSSAINQGNLPPSNLNNLNLSRRHAQLRVDGHRLEVKPVSQSTALYHLDDDGKLLTTPSQALAPIKLEINHKLVVGNFILQFKPFN